VVLALVVELQLAVAQLAVLQQLLLVVFGHHGGLLGDVLAAPAG